LRRDVERVHAPAVGLNSLGRVLCQHVGHRITPFSGQQVFGHGDEREVQPRDKCSAFHFRGMMAHHPVHIGGLGGHLPVREVGGQAQIANIVG